LQTNPVTTGRPHRLLLLAAAVPVILGASIVVGQQTTRSVSATAVALPIGAAAGVVLLAFAYARFEAFVLACLAIRSVVDLARPASDSAGQQQSGMAAAALALVFMATAAIWLLAERRIPGRRPHSAVTIALMVFVAACVLSIPGSGRPILSSAETARILASVLMFIVLERVVTDRARVVRVLAACYCSAIVPITLSVYQGITGNGTLVVDGVSRARGSFVHPNDLAFYSAQLIVMGAAMYPHVGRRTRPALFALMLACSGALLLTYSRGNWLAAMTGVVVVGAIQSRKLIFVLVIVMLVLFLAVPSVAHRVTSVNEQRTARGTAGNTLVWRLDYWRELLAFGTKNPVTGIGMKMTEYSTDSSRPPHNDFLKVYLEAGIIGLIAYLVVLVTLTRAALHAVRTSQSGLARGIAVGFAGCLVALLVESLGGNVVGQVAALWYFFAFAALGSAVPLLAAPTKATDVKV
jgi:O-antigen ligase